MGNKKNWKWQPEAPSTEPHAAPAHSFVTGTLCPKCKSASTVKVNGVYACNACGNQGWK